MTVYAVWSALLAITGGPVQAQDSLESCAAAKSFSANCTQLRAASVDANGDGFVDDVEGNLFLRKFDWPVQKAVGAGKQLDQQAEIAWLDVVALRGDDLAEEPLDVAGFLGAVLYRNRTWRPTSRVVSPRVAFSASRRLGDSVDPRGGTDVKPRPVVVAYREDRVSRESGVQVLGTLSANFLPWYEAERAIGGSSALVITPSVGIAFDVDTAAKTRGKNKSDITIGPSLSLLAKGNHDLASWTDHYLTLSPIYQTDADFGRDAVNLTATYTVASTKLGRASLNNVFCERCAIGPWIWYWRPSLQLIAGEVNDASGSETLAVLAQQGSYVRIVPALSFRLFPENSAWSLGFDWQGLRDDEGRHRSYRELSYQYDLRTNVAFTAIYRKGTKPSSFQYVDAVLLGLGFQY